MASKPAPAAAPNSPTEFDPLHPQIPPPVLIEDEADSRIRQMIESRKSPSKEPEKKEEAKEEEKEKESTPESKADAGKAIADALGFRKSKTKEEEKKAKDGEADKKEEEKKAEPAKTTIVGKKKPAPQLDPVKMASEVAAAVTRETLKASQLPAKEEKQDEFPAELVNEDDRSEYEVAKHLASINPKYKNAPNIIVEHARKAKAYADKWETANPGKVFDPDAEEHNEFYAGIQPPWSEREFLRAEIALENKKEKERAEKAEEPVRQKKKIEEDMAALAPVVQSVTQTTAAILAKGVGDDVFNSITKDGFQKFAESDPITAEQLGVTLETIKPLLEAIVQLDDPEGRVKYDEKNQMHNEWARYVTEKEAQLYGEEDAHGRTLVGRTEYASMSVLQRKKHWMLGRDELIAQLAKDAIDMTKEAVSAELEKQKKIAERLGYVPKQEQGGEKKKSEATTKKKVETEEEEAEAVTKPQSPSVGSGAKIDTKEEQKPTGYNGVLEATHGILFSR